VTGAPVRYVITGFEGPALPAIRAVLTACGVVILDEALDRGLLVAASETALAQARERLPELRIAAERDYRLS
jgi:hypothetical protein